MNASSEGAEARAVRVVGALFGVGSVVFVALLAPTILAQAGDVAIWWTPASLVGVLVLPILMTVTSFVVPLRILRALAGGTAAAYLGSLLTLPVLQVARVGVHDATPWILGLTAVGTTAAAVAWRPRLAWAYLGAAGLLVVLDRIWTGRVPLLLVALQDGAYATFLCAVFCGLAMGARSAGRAVDIANAGVLRAAAETAVREATDAERKRVNALVHDEVLATLLLASRTTGEIESDLRGAAGHALDRLCSLKDEEPDSSVVPFDHFLSRLRGAATNAAPHAPVDIDADGRLAALPATASESLLAAMAEALRNAVLHAGRSVPVAVSVEQRGASVRILIEDRGAGFDPATVPPARLGVAGSILGRMAESGGLAEVRSAPGAGTRVELRWPAT